jgi:hypothetical protein
VATHTLVTAANLTAVTYSPSPNVLLPADLATIANSILVDNAFGNTVPGAVNFMGILTVPGRGTLKTLPGDVWAFDTATGWPILVSAKAIAGGGWTFT